MATVRFGSADRTSAAAPETYGVAIEVPDAAAACKEVWAKGGVVTREAGPVKGGTTVIAFVQDPDGYKIELIEHKPATG